MACPTCDETMQGLGYGIFWCPRCGSILQEQTGHTPALVRRVRELYDTMHTELRISQHDIQLWHRLGISEAIDLPGCRLTQ